jgi:2-polyprenyl-6-hydroxyphenyl methylase/3-demethylubiquinone-9 3-methyltransferase
MGDYYKKGLAAERLRACYDLAPPRTRQYLDAEIAYVLEKSSPHRKVLELGCGYGRILKRLAGRVGLLTGIDTSFSSLIMAKEYLSRGSPCHLALMQALFLGFPDHQFDLTLCLQNGISAFAVDRQALFREALRVTRSGGTMLFSSYSERFWKDRLEWFEIQSAHGLIGPLDYEATGNGQIVCQDGFRATTVDAEGFKALAAGINLEPVIFEIDQSSLFCEIRVP